MSLFRTQEQTENSDPAREPARRKWISAFRSRGKPDDSHPSLIHFSAMPLFRLESCADRYKHLLKEKDVVHISPIVNYLISGSGHVVYLGGDAVRNLYLNGRRSYKTINILAILGFDDIERYSFVMNNIISSNEGAFSMGEKYRAKRNWCAGCFKDIALARYLIEPRLMGPEKMLYPFRPATIELDLTTERKFSQAFGVEVV